MPNFNGNLSTLEDKGDFWALYDFHLPSYIILSINMLFYFIQKKHFTLFKQKRKDF